MDINHYFNQNTSRLKENQYPGRGIIIGLTPDQKNFVQVYWIMGRSENSRNRTFVREHDSVKTQAYDVTKLIDPSLIIYYPIKVIHDSHIVSNGDQTDTIVETLQGGGTFENALNQREFEPDRPNYTPRISGIIDLNDPKHAYKLSILKSFNNNPAHCSRHIYSYETAIPGVGHCITTYAGDGNPLPSYHGEPFIVETFNNIEETADYYWSLLQPENKVSLLVKFINAESKEASIKIINRHE